MTSKTKQEICDILIAKGPDLLQKIELSELFYQYLGSEKVLQDATQLRDLKAMKPSEQTTWLLDHLRRGDTERCNGFIRALIYTRQYDVVTILQEDPSEFCAASSSVGESHSGRFKALKQHYISYLGRPYLYEFASRSPLFQLEDVFTKLKLVDNQNDKMSHGRPAFMSEREHTTISLQEMLKLRDRAASIIMEGKAGSGKTTLLKHLAIRWAEKNLAESPEEPNRDPKESLPFLDKKLVVFVDKRHEGKDLDETIKNALKGSAEEKDEALTFLRRHPGKSFLLVDALNEFRTKKVIKEVFRLASEGSVNVLVSCREGHPCLKDGMENFTQHVKVVGFEPDDAQNFVKKFMKILLPENEWLRMKKTMVLSSHIQKAKVSKMYASPIICVLLCLLYTEGKVSDEELSKLTMTTLFSKQQEMLLRRECHKRARGFSDKIEKCMFKEAETTLEIIYRLALSSLLHQDQQPWYTSTELEEYGIDVDSPAMVLLVKEPSVSVDGEEEIYKWPHEMVQEFHAAKAVRSNAVIYYIASRPELNVVSVFLVSMIAETDMERAKYLFTAMLLLQSEVACSRLLMDPPQIHCCSQISKLKDHIQKQSIDSLLGLAARKSPKLKKTLNVPEIQECLRNTEWFLFNSYTLFSLVDYMDVCTSKDIRTGLYSGVFHPFLPSIAPFRSVMQKLRGRGYSMDEEIPADTMYYYPSTDSTTQVMIANLSSAGSVEWLSGDHGQAAGYIGTEEEKGVIHLNLSVSSSLRLDDFTKHSLQQLAKRIGRIDRLDLLIDREDDSTWENESYMIIRDIIKPTEAAYVCQSYTTKDSDGKYKINTVHFLIIETDGSLHNFCEITSAAFQFPEFSR